MGLRVFAVDAFVSETLGTEPRSECTSGVQQKVGGVELRGRQPTDMAHLEKSERDVITTAIPNCRVIPELG